MKRPDFYNLAFEAICPILTGSSFEFKKSKMGWVNNTNPEIQVATYIGFWKTGDECSTTMSFCVRINYVEDIINKYRQINPLEAKNTQSLILYLPQIINHSDSAFRFFTIQDAENIISQYYVPFTKEKLFDLFLYYSDLNNFLDTFYNENNANYFLLNKIETYTYPIIVAKMLARNDFNEIVEACQMRFQLFVKYHPYSQIAEWYKQNFNSLIHELTKT